MEFPSPIRESPSRNVVRRRRRGTSLSEESVSSASSTPASRFKKVQSWLSERGFRVLFEGSWKKRAASCFSGLIVGLYMWTFCAVFSATVFGESANLQDAVPVGVNVQTASAAVSGLATALFSTIPVNIAGPDVTIVFLLVSVRQDVESIKGLSKTAQISTLLFTGALCSLLVAVVFMFMGYFRLSRIFQYVPIPVLSGFLACIGYRVMQEALHTAEGHTYYSPGTSKFWKLAAPSIVLGLALFLSKRFHVGKPVIVVPAVILSSIALFYIILAASDTSIQFARDYGWLYPDFDAKSFTDQWREISFYEVSGQALGDNVAQILTMLLLVVVDYLFKMQAAKRALGLSVVDLDHEMRMTGLANLVHVPLLAVPGYSQVEHTRLNYGVLRGRDNRVSGVISAVLNAILFFWSSQPIKFVPRFVLGGILISAGLPFLVENVIDTLWQMNFYELLIVWAIVGLNAALGLPVAVASGIGLAALFFVWEYGRQAVVVSSINGTNYRTKVVRSLMEWKKLDHLSQQYHIMKLRFHIFFGSANQVMNRVIKLLEEREDMWRPSRAKYLILDMTEVVALDFSAAGVFADMFKLLSEFEFSKVVLAGISDDAVAKLRAQNMVLSQHDEESEKDTGFVVVCHDLDHAAEYVEDCILRHSRRIRDRWYDLDPILSRLHQKAKLMATHEVLEQALGGQLSTELWKYVSTEHFPQGKQICEVGVRNHTLYMVLNGKVSTFLPARDGSLKRVHSVRRGAFVNEESLFLDVPSTRTVEAMTDCTLFSITREQWQRMEEEEPRLAMGLQRTVLHHTALRQYRLERDINSQTLDDPLAVMNRVRAEKFQSRVRGESAAGRALKNVTTSDGSPSNTSRLFKTQSLSRRHSHRTPPARRPHRRVAKNLDAQFRSSASATSLPALEASALESNPGGFNFAMSNMFGARALRRANQRSYMDLCGNMDASEQLRTKGPTKLQLSLKQQRDAITRFRMSQKAGTSGITFQDMKLCLYDMGLFPLETELVRIMNENGWSTESIVREEQFLHVVEKCALAPLSEAQLQRLAEVFVTFNGSRTLGEALNTTQFSNLMTALGHPMGTSELRDLLVQWFGVKSCLIYFDSFVSMAAWFIKGEEIQAEVWDLFQGIARAGQPQQEDNSDLTFSEQDVMFAFASNGIDLTMQEAEEMVYDSAELDGRCVTFPEWLHSISTVHDFECQEATTVELPTTPTMQGPGPTLSPPLLSIPADDDDASSAGESIEDAALTLQLEHLADSVVEDDANQWVLRVEFDDDFPMQSVV